MLPKGLIDSLFQEERVSLRRYLVFRLRDHDDAEDVLHDTYLRLQGARQETPIGNPKGLLFRIASNLAIDRLRQRKRITKHELPQITDEETGEQPYMTDTPSPEDSVAAEQRLERILQSINALPPKCRHVFILHKFKDMSYSEIATSLDISKKTVEYHMTQALLQLRDV